MTDVGVAGVLKKKCEAVKQEVRREKRRADGGGGIEEAFQHRGKDEVKCTNEDLLKIVTEGFRRMKEEDQPDGEAGSERLLKVCRACGWLSYQADPVSKKLVRVDQQDWFNGREEALAEVSHRHPKVWWEGRYEWKEGEEPVRPDYKTCGNGVRALNYSGFRA